MAIYYKAVEAFTMHLLIVCISIIACLLTTNQASVSAAVQPEPSDSRQECLTPEVVAAGAIDSKAVCLDKGWLCNRGGTACCSPFQCVGQSSNTTCK